MRFLPSLIISVLLPCSAFAQKVIKPVEIKKILITSTAAGMSSAGGSDFEILQQQGKWSIYYIRQFNEKFREPAYNRVFKIPIGVMPPLLLSNFLNSIAVIKPQFDWRVFGLTPASFKNIPSNKGNSKTPKIEDFINDKTLAEAIKASGGNGAMDFMPTVTIKIVKTNKDTLKIESHEQGLCMVPWTIGKTRTFDINISRFVAAVVNNCGYTNYDILRTDEIKQNVLRYIEDNYASAAIGNYNWTYGYSQNLKLIKSNFNISYLTFAGNERRCKLSCKDWPASVSVDATISIDDLAGIQHLIKFKDTISRYINDDNFAFKYYGKLPGSQIIFPFDPKFKATDYVVLGDLERTLPALTKTDPGKWVNFTIKSQEGNSKWLIVSNNKLVLLAHTGEKVATVSYSVLQKQERSDDENFSNYDALLLFNSNGTENK